MKKITEYLNKKFWPGAGCIIVTTILLCPPAVWSPLPSLAGQQRHYLACTAWLSAGENLSLKKNRFSMHDKVYLILRFQALASGEYTISSDWLNPEGQLEQQNSHTFSLKKQSDYTYYAWVSLMKNGPLKRMVTGSAVERKFHGSWQVLVTLNGQRLDTLTFDMF